MIVRATLRAMAAVGVAPALVVCTLSAGGPAPLVDLVAPESTRDEYSGEKVSDRDHAQGMIGERFDNPPLVGETAPETRFIDPETQEEVRLAELLSGKSLVLIFGSWSCPTTNVYLEEYGELASRFGNEANFCFIYIREAHPAGGFKLKLEHEMADVDLPEIVDPVKLDGRCTLAREFQSQHRLPMRFLVDTIDDEAATIWGAWPTRIFVIDSSGMVTYSGGQGPWYYKPTKEGWHYPPPEPLEALLNSRPFSRTSLEEFLEERMGEGAGESR